MYNGASTDVDLDALVKCLHCGSKRADPICFIEEKFDGMSQQFSETDMMHSPTLIMNASSKLFTLLCHGLVPLTTLLLLIPPSQGGQLKRLSIIPLLVLQLAHLFHLTQLLMFPLRARLPDFPCMLPLPLN